MQLTLSRFLPGAQLDRADLTRAATASSSPPQAVRSLEEVSEDGRVVISEEAVAALALEMNTAGADIVPGTPDGMTLIAEKVPEFDAEAYNACIDAWIRRGPDLQDIADALVTTMREVVNERPDLADKHFDFKRDGKRLEVVSKELSAKDAAWLTGKLNANPELKDAVRRFHDDTVNMYALYYKGVGQPLSDAELAEADRGVDGMFKFIEQLDIVGETVRRNYRSSEELTYLDGSGQPITLEADPGTAQGLLDFMDKLKSFSDAPISTVDMHGHKSTPYKFNDPFAHVGILFATFTPKNPRPSHALEIAV